MPKTRIQDATVFPGASPSQEHTAHLRKNSEPWSSLPFPALLTSLDSERAGPVRPLDGGVSLQQEGTQLTVNRAWAHSSQSYRIRSCLIITHLPQTQHFKRFLLYLVNSKHIARSDLDDFNFLWSQCTASVNIGHNLRTLSI